MTASEAAVKAAMNAWSLHQFDVRSAYRCECGDGWSDSHAPRAVADAVAAIVAREARRSRHCGCGWCCAGTDPAKRGEAHKGCSA